MFDRIVVGADPGIAATGLAAVGAGKGAAAVVWAETVRTPPGQAEEVRLRALHEAVRARLLDHRPEALAIERLMWGRNAASAMGVARASGVLMLAAAELGIPVHEYAPLEVKMAVTGNGNARKEVVRRSLARLLGVRGVPAQADAADAVAVAVCHLQRDPLRRAIGAAR